MGLLVVVVVVIEEVKGGTELTTMTMMLTMR